MDKRNKIVFTCLAFLILINSNAHNFTKRKYYRFKNGTAKIALQKPEVNKTKKSGKIIIKKNDDTASFVIKERELDVIKESNTIVTTPLKTTFTAINKKQVIELPKARNLHQPQKRKHKPALQLQLKDSKSIQIMPTSKMASEPNVLYKLTFTFLILVVIGLAAYLIWLISTSSIGLLGLILLYMATIGIALFILFWIIFAMLWQKHTRFT